MNLRNRISGCRKYETDRLPKYLQYLKDEFRGIRRNLELQLDRQKEEIRYNLREVVYA